MLISSYLEIAYVFCEFCENGDLKKWLSSNISKFSKDSTNKKHSLIIQHRKKFSQGLNDLIEFKKSNKRNSVDFQFNDLDLIFFCYQIANGIESLI
jgi:hypothetical protein